MMECPRSPIYVAIIIAFMVSMLPDARTAIAFDPTSPTAPSLPFTMTTADAQDMIWTRWQRNEYALADDGLSLWIGAAGGIIRWDKATATYRRYTAVDGLPHQNVYAVAVDSYLKAIR